MAMTVLIIIAVACLIQRWIVATHSKWFSFSLCTRFLVLVFKSRLSGPHKLTEWNNIVVGIRQWMKENRSIDAKVQRKKRERRTYVSTDARVARNNKQTIFRRRRCCRFRRQQMAKIKFGAQMLCAHDVRKHPCIRMQISDKRQHFRGKKETKKGLNENRHKFCVCNWRAATARGANMDRNWKLWNGQCPEKANSTASPLLHTTQWKI